MESTKGKTIHFRGMLSNVDSSILKVPFANGFTVECLSEDEAEAFLEKAESLNTKGIGEKYFLRLKAVNPNEKKAYAIHNTFEGSSDTFSTVAKFDNTYFRASLSQKIRLLRLFKEGDIRMPIHFYYLHENNEIKSILHAEESLIPVSFQDYHIEPNEVDAVKSFIETTEFPFKKAFLDLAFENFELSYQIADSQLAFLVLMIGLETLLNPSNNEVKYRVSRNMAVLLGRTPTDATSIFKEIKEMYDKRSEIVHSGKRKVVNQQDILKLRKYLRDGIKEVYSTSKDKDELLTLLTYRGFGVAVTNQ